MRDIPSHYIYLFSMLGDSERCSFALLHLYMVGIILSERCIICLASPSMALEMAASAPFRVANENVYGLLCISSSMRPRSSARKLPPPRYASHFHSSHFLGFSLYRVYGHGSRIPSLSRRLLLPTVSGIWDALTGGGSAREAVVAVRRGMLLFRQGDVPGSLVEFDKAIELDPRQRAYLWQRGLSLYYLDRFKEGAEQFRLDVAQNPNDTEESIWCFLCEAQLYGADEARRQFLEVGTDPRPVMREAYNVFKYGGDSEQLVKAFGSRNENEYFYASLYAGLYYESQDKDDEAELHIVAACKSIYGSRSDDYMASVAEVHCRCRRWSPDQQ